MNAILKIINLKPKIIIYVYMREAASVLSLITIGATDTTFSIILFKLLNSFLMSLFLQFFPLHSKCTENLILLADVYFLVLIFEKRKIKNNENDFVFIF